jgi:two-component system sensor histidine kinase PilS (NtrC family)
VRAAVCLPVLLASVLGPILASGTVMVTLLLLTNAWLQLAEWFYQPALCCRTRGSAFFLVALAPTSWSSVWRCRNSPCQPGRARMQTLVSDLVVETLAEGVLVVDRASYAPNLSAVNSGLLSPAKRRHFAG